MPTPRPTTRMRSSTSSQVSPPRVTALWFGVQLIWGAVLGISLQARCVQLAGDASLATFGVISASGAFAAAMTQLVVGPLSDMLRRRGRGRGTFYAAGALLGAKGGHALSGREQERFGGPLEVAAHDLLGRARATASLQRGLPGSEVRATRVARCWRVCWATRARLERRLQPVCSPQRPSRSPTCGACRCDHSRRSRRLRPRAP